jgi:hypothetical protein
VCFTYPAYSIAQIGANFTFCGAISRGLLGLKTTFRFQLINFENVETLMVELRKCLLNTLYMWIASQFECFYLCRFFKLIFCLFLLGHSCILHVY